MLLLTDIEKTGYEENCIKEMKLFRYVKNVCSAKTNYQNLLDLLAVSKEQGHHLPFPSFVLLFKYPGKPNSKM